MRARAIHHIVGIAALLGSILSAKQALAYVGDGQGGHESDQGTSIFATLDPELEDLLVPYVPDWRRGLAYDSLSIPGGRLKAMRNGRERRWQSKDFPIVLATTNRNIVFKVHLAQPHTNIYSQPSPAGIWEYNVWVDNAGVLSPLCNTATNLALVVPGSWDNKQLDARAIDKGFRFSCLPVIDSSHSSRRSSLTVQRAFAREYSVAVMSSAPYISPQSASGIRSTISSPAKPSASAIKLSASAYLMETTRPLFLNETEIIHGGAAAKCIDLGYAPWASAETILGKPTVLGGSMPASSDVTARRFHNVCVQAMTADYAGDGTSHTISGTVIGLFDLTNVPAALCNSKAGQPTCSELSPRSNAAYSANLAPISRPGAGNSSTVAATTLFPVGQTIAGRRSLRAAAQKDGLLVEGAWFEDQTGKARALCLAKARWLTIDAFQFAQDELSSQTINPNLSTATGVPWDYCDDLKLADLVARAGEGTPLLISYSSINERGLWRYESEHGSITTTHIQITPQGTYQPEPGLPLCASSPCIPIFEGDLLSPDAPIDHIAQHDPVYLCKNDQNEYATVTLATAWRLPAGYHFVYSGDGSNSSQLDCGVVPSNSSVIPEGYVFRGAPPLPSGHGFGGGVTSLELLLLAEKPSAFLTVSNVETSITHDKKILRTGILGYLLFPVSLVIPPLPQALQKRIIEPLLGDPPPDYFGDPLRGVTPMRVLPAGSSVAPTRALPAGSPGG